MEFRRREADRRWRIQWKEKLKMERVEKERVERKKVEKCEMKARVAERVEKDEELSYILSEEEGSEVGEDLSWLGEASDHFSEIEFEDDDLLLSSLGPRCEIFTVEEDIVDADKSLKPKSAKHRRKEKYRGKFSPATRCLPTKALQQIPSSSSSDSKSCPTRPGRVKAPETPGYAGQALRTVGPGK